MTDNTRVFNCDCLPAMKEFPDKHFDLAICDPPYGITQPAFRKESSNKAAKTKNYNHSVYTQEPPDHRYFAELFRVSKNQIIWGANYFNDYLSSGCQWIFWDKRTEATQWGDGELAFTSFEGAIAKFDFAWNGMIQGDMKNKEERIHPTQKPVALYKWLLKNYAKEGDKILDTHGGSMSSVIACLDMGFPITCYELDTDYYNAGKNRIINHLNQLNAFRPAYEIEFHDSTGVSTLRNQQGSGYKEQNNGENKEPIHRIDGLFHGDTV